jgi:acylphosphatase
MPQWSLGCGAAGKSRMSVLDLRHVLIHGRVQGIGYRAWTEDTARDLGLQGWVRNRRDGAVEAVFAGSGEDVAKMIEACRQGPYGAHVTGIDQRPGTSDDLAMRRSGEGFSVLPTA